MKQLTHVNKRSEAKMVDVSGKEPTLREAKASAVLFTSPGLIHLIEKKALPKGDVLSVAKVAGIQAAKKTHELIPMCHPLRLSHVDIDITLHADSIRISSTVRALDRTGVEMEALVAVTVAALTVYDMCKSFEKGVTISDVMLLKKSGGRSGVWKRERK